MDIKQVDQELAEALKYFPIIDFWDDISAARLKGKLQVIEAKAQLPEMEGVDTHDCLVPGLAGAPDVSIRIYQPVGVSQPLPALLWLHGGGYVLGNVEETDFIMKELSVTVGCAVISVEYRLAPENPFPAPLEDCYSALKWLATNTAELGVDQSRIAIGGLSAGGGMAAGLALLARDRAEINISFQMLLCPMIDSRNITPSSYRITDNRIWNRDCNSRAWAAYLGKENTSHGISPYAAPSLAKNLKNLPPTYIAVGELDLFVDENIEYAKRLVEVGVTTELKIFPGGFHGFEYLVPEAKLSRYARKTHFDRLRQAFLC